MTRVAADLGYDADFVTEADVIHRTEFVLRDRFARIATVQELVEELRVIPSREDGEESPARSQAGGEGIPRRLRGSG